MLPTYECKLEVRRKFLIIRAVMFWKSLSMGTIEKRNLIGSKIMLNLFMNRIIYHVDWMTQWVHSSFRSCVLISASLGPG